MITNPRLIGKIKLEFNCPNESCDNTITCTDIPHIRNMIETGFQLHLNGTCEKCGKPYGYIFDREINEFRIGWNGGGGTRLPHYKNYTKSMFRG